jgi:four helix bundle protein
MIHNFRELQIWKEALDLATDIYLITCNFPDTEKFGLVSQMCRSAYSVPSNIAEGSAYHSNKKFQQFLDIALGSSYEVETQLIISNRIGLISDSDFLSFEKKLNRLQRKIANFRAIL